MGGTLHCNLKQSILLILTQKVISIVINKKILVSPITKECETPTRLVSLHILNDVTKIEQVRPRPSVMATSTPARSSIDDTIDDALRSAVRRKLLEDPQW